MSDTSYSRRIEASYGEAIEELSKRYSVANNGGHLRATIFPYVHKHPVRTAALTGASMLAVGASIYQWGFAVTAAQAVGIAALVIAKESATFKEHRHILAIASISCVASATQQGIMAASTINPGSYIPGGIMLAHAAATVTAFAVIPEAKKAFRQAVTWGGGLAGAFAAAYASYKYENGNGIIPAMTTLGNSLMFSIKDGSTPKARLAYMGMNAAHMIYWATQPVVSVALLATEAMYLATHGTTLAQHDVPTQNRETGKHLGFGQQINAYFNGVIAQGKKAEDLGITRAEQGWSRWDDRVYKGLKSFVLGE